jgi:gluconolactonase
MRIPEDSMEISRLDPAFDALVPTDARIEKLARGFKFTEGPLWRPSGVLWFSDLVGNVVHQWSPDGKVADVLRPGGYDGNSLPAGGFIGPNGMTAGPDGSVLLCQHGNRRIVRIGRDRSVTTIVDKFEGKKLNAPNDLVYRSDGSLYFSDPPYGLPKQDDDPAKELSFNGVFKLKDGKLRVVVDDLSRPNGLAFSPDEKTLYVANSDETRRVWMRYEVTSDGNLRNGTLFADASASKESGVPDGMKVDVRGNIWATGPSAIWVLSPKGKHLGTIKPPEDPANCAWGDDGKTLYITAETGVYRLKTSISGQPLVY